MDSGTREARPRAFHPDRSPQYTPPAVRPGWDLGPERRLDDGRSLARAMGWFSIGLGVAELVAPRKITRFLGVDESHTGLVRFYGAREIASGVAILASQRDPSAGMWSRVGGDLLDLGTLGAAMRDDRANHANIGVAMAMVAGAAALDVLAVRQLYSTADAGERA